MITSEFIVMGPLENDKKSFITKDVIIIGNGPSGINLSYMLSGNWPYYNGDMGTVSDEFLQMRLDSINAENSLVEQDLGFLSSGLVGRSLSSVAVLFDALTHPGADMGQQNPSLLEWKKVKHTFDHVVLGKNAEGGVWQMLKGGMQTLSLGNWMELPGLAFKQWLANHRQKYDREIYSEERATIDEVRSYYECYVRVHDLKKYFHNYTTVTQVQKVLDICHGIDSESGEQIPCGKNHCDSCVWEVTGYETLSDNTRQEFCYRSPHVVIASGAHDQSNKLNVGGENLPYIHYNLHEVENLIRDHKIHAGTSDPLVVIGAGLSAADAINYAMNVGINVVHIFRQEGENSSTIYQTLPTSVYPEYDHIHKLMLGQQRSSLYQCYPAHQVVEFCESGEVLIRHQDGQTNGTVVINASCVVVQIGYQADLSYLPHSGENLGKTQSLAIHPKHNPIAIDTFTYQSVHAANLFSIGPLVGDSFVRFLCGGALAITSHLFSKKLKAPEE